jgi:hypothetical protein
MNKFLFSLILFGSFFFTNCATVKTVATTPTMEVHIPVGVYQFFSNPKNKTSKKVFKDTIIVGTKRMTALYGHSYRHSWNGNFIKHMNDKDYQVLFVCYPGRFPSWMRKKHPFPQYPNQKLKVVSEGTTKYKGFVQVTISPARAVKWQ